MQSATLAGFILKGKLYASRNGNVNFTHIPCDNYVIKMFIIDAKALSEIDYIIALDDKGILMKIIFYPNSIDITTIADFIVVKDFAVANNRIVYALSVRSGIYTIDLKDKLYKLVLLGKNQDIDLVNIACDPGFEGEALVCLDVNGNLWGTSKFIDLYANLGNFKSNNYLIQITRHIEFVEIYFDTVFFAVTIMGDVYFSGSDEIVFLPISNGSTDHDSSDDDSENYQSSEDNIIFYGLSYVDMKGLKIKSIFHFMNENYVPFCYYLDTYHNLWSYKQSGFSLGSIKFVMGKVSSILNGGPSIFIQKHDKSIYHYKGGDFVKISV